MPQISIACIGEAMVELSLGPSDASRIAFAGDVLNTAIYLRRSLDPRHQVAFVSTIGRDPLSDRMAAFIASEGLPAGTLARHPDRLPGLYAISLDAEGERSFLYWRDHSAARTMFQDADFGSLAEHDVIYLSAITLAILPVDVRHALLGWIAMFRRRGGRFAFDSNYRPRLWPSRLEAQDAVMGAWSLADIALPSLDDEMALFGDADAAAVRARLRAAGVRHGALKAGSRGPQPIDGDMGDLVFAPAPRVVDTTAAGDSFNGAYLARLLSGGSQAEALQAGHAMAVHVIGHAGAIAPRPSKAV